MYSKRRFSKFKKFVSRSVFGDFQLTQISLNFQNFYCNLKVRGLGVKLYVGFLLFLFCNELWRFKVKTPCFLLNKNLNFNRNEAKLNWKWKIPHTVLKRWTMRMCISVTFILPERSFLTFGFYLNVQCIE